MDDKIISLQIRIYGRVQNVGFRWAVYNEAIKLGILGFVRNQPDRSVYIEIEGSEVILAQFEAWCFKGSLGSRVEEVKVRRQPVCNFSSFEIRR